MVETKVSEETERTLQNDGLALENTRGPEVVAIDEPLPPLHTPHPKRKIKVAIGVTLATLDLACLPIVYYYAFKFGTSLSLQDSKKRAPSNRKIWNPLTSTKYLPLLPESTGSSAFVTTA
jgi:hypothetical protein